MIRSLITNEVLYPDPDLPNVTQWQACSIFYKNAYWDLGNMLVGGDVLNYRRLRLVSDQYLRQREEVQRITSLEVLEWWLTHRQFAVFCAPINVMDKVQIHAFKSLMIRKMRRVEDIDNTYRHRDVMEEFIKGPGWSCDIIVHMNSGPFNANALRTGLAALGIYSLDAIYDGPVGSRFYRLPCYILERDFDLFSDADQKPWRASYQDDDEDDEDDDELISEGEARARWFEDGLLDDEIEGLDDDLV